MELDGQKKDYYTTLKKDGAAKVTELPIFNEGRCLCMTFSNVNGGFFELEGGVELEMGLRRRTE